MSGTATDDLARKASRGEQRALEKIYRDYHQPLYRFCLAIVGNPQDAQDALQNTMVKMLRALPGEKRSIALKPWLYRIAHNESIDLLRRRRPGISLEASELQLGDDLAVQLETRQRLRQLIADLGALPERQRETLLMREAAGLSFEEIGAALETSPAVARQTLYEARLGLRQMDAGREMECEAVAKALSDGDGRVRRRRDIRAHLRDCGQCRRFAEEIDSRSNALAAISPLPAVAAAAMLQGLIGGGTAGSAAAGAGAGGVGGLVGGAAAKSVGTMTLLKGVAAVAVVAAVGIGAADRAGLIQVGSGNSGSKAATGAGPTGAEPPAAPDGGASDSAAARSRGEGRGSARSSLSKATSVRAGGADRAIEPVRGTSQPASEGDPAASGRPPAGSGSADTAASPEASGVEHPHGRGHAKQTPPAAAHGQETAASHKPEKSHSSSGTEPGSSKSKSAEHPAHPTHPATPATTSPPPAAEPKAKSPPGEPSK